MNGFYSNRCHSDFVQGRNRVAKDEMPNHWFSTKRMALLPTGKCSKNTQSLLWPSVTPARLELTSNKSRSAPHLWFPTRKKDTPTPARLLPAQQQAVAPSSTLDCAGRPNGHYSKDCSNDFVTCNDGVATAMKCPPMLKAVKLAVRLSLTNLLLLNRLLHRHQISHAVVVKIKYYSDGCFFRFCLHRASCFKCPAGLVFNEKAGYCNYLEGCGGTSEAESLLKPSKDSTATLMHQRSSTTWILAAKFELY
ncbi:unnamed protein product [Cylicocyclus nassatus]|uniref:Chitin-binding type-2 domain-containing protein n=1 Tax=Cylicocyclus nassatus TaxID=53992 RepID=A0AA36HGI8_CYLNA|nr:unnamed protein product [Cylicocyclus nassatus]